MIRLAIEMPSLISLLCLISWIGNLARHEILDPWYNMPVVGMMVLMIVGTIIIFVTRWGMAVEAGERIVWLRK